MGIFTGILSQRLVDERFSKKSQRQTSTIFCRNAPVDWVWRGKPAAGTRLVTLDGDRVNGRAGHSIFLLQRANFFLGPVDFGSSATSHGQKFFLPVEIQDGGIQFRPIPFPRC